ncbi:MAG: DUF58 domain-containing protein [Ilumatobacter sp.]|uniref:DUF58 domain-containing protein n=1 Tax=Ilumatobacter sp. TaxID=1967498 RepID=UPI00391C266C
MLTRSGLGALIAAVVLAVLGVWWRYEEMILAAIAVGVLLLLAVWIAQRPLRATVQRRVTTMRVPRGDPIRLSYRVRNDTRYRSGRATLIDHCDEQVSTTTIEPVAPNSVSDVEAQIPTRRRGVFPVGPLDVERIDPFFLAVGRWRDERDGERPTAVTVHPKIYDLIGPQGAVRVVENESIIRRAATDPMSGFVSMREYVAGDDPRLIHWPTTARTGTLMVREHVEVRRPEFTIVVDTSADVATADDFEEAVDVAATLAVHALRGGLDVVVRTTERSCSGRPTALVSDAQVLDLLTPVQQSNAESLLPVPALFDQGFGRTAIVVVTGPGGPSSRVMAIEQMLTVRIGAGATGGTGIALAAVDAVDFVNRWRTGP